MARPALPSVPRRAARTTVMAALALAACSPRPAEKPPPERSEPRPGGTLVVATGSDIAGVNQLTSDSTRFSQDVIDQLFLHLFEEQPDFEEHPPSFAPELAQSWEWSADRLALTVELRADVRWSDGRPVTADDVAWTHEAMVDERVGWAYAHGKDAIATVEALDPRTVRFSFHRPTPHALAAVNEGVILPRHAWGALPLADWRGSGLWFVEHLVVDGPFLLASWEPQQEIVLERNPAYFRPGRPLLERVVFRVVPDREAQLLALLAGEVDFLPHLLPEHAARVAAAPGVDLLAYWHRQYGFISWNACRPLFADANVRRALTQAIDRQGLVDALWAGRARVAVSPILSNVWAHDRTLEPWPYDPRAATEALAAAGWEDRDGDGVVERQGERFSFELSTNGDNRLRVDAAVMIQSQLAKIGVEAEIRLSELNALIDRNLAHDYDATIGAWGIDTTLDLGYAFHSESIENGYNFGCYSEPEVDRLIERVRAAPDAAGTGADLARLQQILHRDQPYTFLWEPQRLAAKRTRLAGASPNALSSYFGLDGWWLAAEE